MARLNDVPVSSSYRLYEFESPDTREVCIHPELVERLERLRRLVGKPIRIVSGYRTVEHNRKVGGVAGSEHRRGRAADVTWAGFDEAAAVAMAERAGFRGIGRYPGRGYVHVDVRERPARWTAWAEVGAGQRGKTGPSARRGEVLRGLRGAR